MPSFLLYNLNVWLNQIILTTKEILVAVHSECDCVSLITYCPWFSATHSFIIKLCYSSEQQLKDFSMYISRRYWYWSSSRQQKGPRSWLMLTIWSLTHVRSNKAFSKTTNWEKKVKLGILNSLTWLTLVDIKRFPHPMFT